MLSFAFELVAMLLLILIAAEVFTNALEHLGEKLGISEGVTGSVFAAVGTALPETMVPLIAIFAGSANSHVNEEIGVGSILGAPLMLATLSIFLMALSVLKKRGIKGIIRPEKSGFIRDMNFFLIAFSFATIAMFVPEDASNLRILISLMLVGTYCAYIFLTFRSSKELVGDGHGTEAHHKMFLARLGLRTTMPIILTQILIGLALLVIGAKGFVYGIENVSQILEISPLVLSLLLIPIATELPEKINSILWVRRGKDTMAVGNITGAMVFQGTLLPAIGIMLTPWQPNSDVIPCIAVTILAAIWLRVNASSSHGLTIKSLMLCGALYVGYITFALA
jgi:cation:H+ antiporter